MRTLVSLWFHMGPYASLWVLVGLMLIGPFAFLWVFMKPCRSLSVFMGPYGSL